MKMTTTKVLPQGGCWIFASQRYSCSLDVNKLPRVDSKYECVLEENNIPYRKFTETTKDYFGKVTTLEFCEYWNADVFEVTPLSLPLYAKMPDDSYHYCDKNYVGEIPTDKTVTAAEKVQRFLVDKIAEYEQILRKRNEYNMAKFLLDGGAATLCKSGNFPYQSVYDIEMNDDRYCVLRVGRIDSALVVIFNVKLIEALKKKGKDIIYLDAPKHVAGLAIGRNHCNTRTWADLLGVKEVRVRPV